MSELSEMKPNLVDKTCKLLKWVCNYRMLHKKLLESSYGNIPSCSWPNHSSDVVKWSSRGAEGTYSTQTNQTYNKQTWTQNTASPPVYTNMGWLGDGSHRGQGRYAWTAVGLPPWYPQSPLKTLGQEMRRAYFTTLASPHGTRELKILWKTTI